jgi:hypothetical protein
MASVLALLAFFVVIALMLGAGWATERRRRPNVGEPTLAEHAAADAGRVGAAAAVGPHDAVALGTPTMLDAIERDPTRSGAR